MRFARPPWILTGAVLATIPMRRSAEWSITTNSTVRGATPRTEAAGLTHVTWPGRQHHNATLGALNAGPPALIAPAVGWRRWHTNPYGVGVWRG